MYLSCIKKELLHTILSYRYLLVLFLFVFMGTVATVVRTNVYTKLDKDFKQAVPMRRHLLESAEYFYQSMGLGVTVEKPPNPLAIFASGLELEMTRSFSVSDWLVPKVGQRKLDAPSFQFLLPLDMVLIVNVICSLLAMLLVFDGVCGEREQGTLKVLLAGPLPRDVVIVGKLVAGLFTIVLPLLITWGIGCAYVLFVAHVNFTADQVARLALIVALSVVCIGFYFALGIAVSCWTQRSATSLAICLFCWIMFVLAVPNLVPIAVNHFVPIPAQSKIIKEKEAVFTYVNNELLPKWRNEFGEQSSFKTVEDLVDSLNRKRDSEVLQRTEGIERFYSNLVTRQLMLNQYVSRLSPASSYLYAATHLAGTGSQDFIRLIGDVDAFQRSFGKISKEQNDRMQEEWKKRRNEWFFKFKNAIDPKVWPAFEPKPAQLAAVINYCWLDVVLLTCGTILLFLVAFVGFVRYDVR